ncbi:MAG: hypothetical protein AAF571_10800 [Verrucomicrobiota bacterium]
MNTRSFLPDDNSILQAMAADCGMDFSTEVPAPDPKLISLFPEELARLHHAIPVLRTPFGISIHISDPMDFESLDLIRHRLGEDLSPVVTPKEIIDKAIDEIYK